MVLEGITAIVAAVVSGGAGLTAIIGLVKWWFERRDRLRAEQRELEAEDEGRAERIPAMFNAFNHLYDALRIPLEKHGAIRCMLLKASDSGNIPRIGIPLFVTVVAEMHEEEYSALRQHWVNRPVDDEYIRRMIKLTTDKQIDIDVESLGENSVLKDSYHLGDVGTADIRYIIQNDREMYYLSIHFPDAIPDNPQYREDMFVVTQTILQILVEEMEAVEVLNGGQ